MEMGWQFNAWPGGGATVDRLAWKATGQYVWCAHVRCVSDARGLRLPPFPVLPSALHAAGENLEPSILLALLLAFSQAQKPSVWECCLL